MLWCMRSAGMRIARLGAYLVGTGYHEGVGQSLEGWLDGIKDALRARSAMATKKAGAES